MFSLIIPRKTSGTSRPAPLRALFSVSAVLTLCRNAFVSSLSIRAWTSASFIPLKILFLVIIGLYPPLFLSSPSPSPGAGSGFGSSFGSCLSSSLAMSSSIFAIRSSSSVIFSSVSAFSFSKASTASSTAAFSSSLASGASSLIASASSDSLASKPSLVAFRPSSSRFSVSRSFLMSKTFNAICLFSFQFFESALFPCVHFTALNLGAIV